MNEFPLPTQSSFLDLKQFDQVFSRFAPQDIEQFQLIYQHWSLQQEIDAVQQQIDAVQRQLAENAAQIERVRPSAIALATLARLQASGVEDIDLLDRMLERGEAWLDRTIQQLAYCEQLDVIRGDYEDWCRHALEDAFAWIDSMQSADSSDRATAPAAVADQPEPPPAPASDTELPAGETTEELFLQKLMSEEPGEIDQGNDASDGSNSDNGEESQSSDDSENGENSENSEDDREQNQPQIQEETAQRRSNFLQRFLSALWP